MEVLTAIGIKAILWFLFKVWMCGLLLTAATTIVWVLLVYLVFKATEDL
jgi:hypothetical protein